MSPLSKLIVAAGLVVVGVLAYNAWEGHVYSRGYAAAETVAKAEAERVGREHAQALANATDAALERERLAREEFDTRAAQWHKEETNYEKRIARLTAAARAGDIGLRVPVDVGSACASPEGADTAVAAGAGRETRAEIVPGVAADLIRIAADSARDVRDFNRIRELYEIARATCNEASR